MSDKTTGLDPNVVYGRTIERLTVELDKAGEWETLARRLSCQTLFESDALWSAETWYKKMIAAWHGDTAHHVPQAAGCDMKGFIEQIFSTYWENSCCDIDGGDIQTWGENFGILRAEPYDPDAHGDHHMVDWDAVPFESTIYVYSPEFKGTATLPSSPVLSEQAALGAVYELPDGWDLYCLGRASQGEYWLEVREIKSGKLARDLGMSLVYSDTIAGAFKSATKMILEKQAEQEEN